MAKRRQNAGIDFAFVKIFFTYAKKGMKKAGSGFPGFRPVMHSQMSSARTTAAQGILCKKASRYHKIIVALFGDLRLCGFKKV